MDSAKLRPFPRTVVGTDTDFRQTAPEIGVSPGLRRISAHLPQNGDAPRPAALSDNLTMDVFQTLGPRARAPSARRNCSISPTSTFPASLDANVPCENRLHRYRPVTPKGIIGWKGISPRRRRMPAGARLSPGFSAEVSPPRLRRSSTPWRASSTRLRLPRI